MSTRPVAFITGASSGVGLAFAESLAKKHDLVLAARRKDRLDALAARVAEEHGAKAEVLAVDLASERGMEAAIARAGHGDVALLVNNAGMNHYGPFAQIEPTHIDELVQLHVRVATRLARAALPGMLERGSGGIVNVASLLAVTGTVPPNWLPLRAVYAGAKAYLLTFSQALAHEVAAKGVRVQALLPGIVGGTEFHDAMRAAKARLPPGMTAPDVVRASLVALAKGEVVCIPPVEEAALFEKIGAAERETFGAVRHTELASRYRDG
jgi:short-subunit dehydrogenase